MSIIITQGAHHVALTVTDMDRSLQFYSEVLGFKILRHDPALAILHDGTIGLGLRLAEDTLTSEERRFNEHRVGLDHLAFRVASAEDVQRAAEHLDALGIAHSGVKPGNWPDSCLVVVRDPDNIQLEFYFLP